jgi:beta-lactamase regulating signal transducer with metallopeptidase domain
MVENFYRRKLVEYIKKNLRKGYPIETLKVALVNQNYSRPIIEEAVAVAMKEMASEAPALKEKPVIEHEIIVDEPNSEKKSFWKKLFGFFGSKK